MNPLLQTTKAGILERQVLKLAHQDDPVFSDSHILKAIEAYDIEGSTKHRAQEFVNALTPLWELYHKGSYVNLFKKFIDMEFNLETFSYEYSPHVNHVIKEFLFGYNILMNCEYLKTEYKFNEGKDNPDSLFGKLFFSWMAASLLHDIGYELVVSKT